MHGIVIISCIIILVLILVTMVMMLLSRHTMVPYAIQRYFVFRVLDKSISDPSLITISNEKGMVNRVWTRGEVGLGESYVDGDWNSKDLSRFLLDLIQTNRSRSSFQKPSWFSSITSRYFSPQQDKTNIEHHYDVGNDFYDIFLTDPFQAYSCAIWSPLTTSLSEAQKNKIDIIIRKMSLKKNKKDIHILDIGCGWGKIGDYVSRETGAQVTGITLSEKQYESAQHLSKENPKWTVKIKDYRDLSEKNKYDAIYSIGMMEHVRVENYNKFFQVVNIILKPGGRMVLHTIIKGEEVDPGYQEIPSYVTAHIFPGGQIPCLGWLEEEITVNGMQVEHVEYFGGQHYAETLLTWRQQLVARTPEILSWKNEKGQQKYPLHLVRSYIYYLTICEMLFRNGKLHTAHLIIVNEPLLKLRHA